jgi:hypothetical protein
MSKFKIDGGSVRPAKDGSGGGAMTTGFGSGTEREPAVRTTTSLDRDGSVKDSHTTVTVEGQEIKLP